MRCISSRKSFLFPLLTHCFAFRMKTEHGVRAFSISTTFSSMVWLWGMCTCVLYFFSFSSLLLVFFTLFIWFINNLFVFFVICLSVIFFSLSLYCCCCSRSSFHFHRPMFCVYLPFYHAQWLHTLDKLCAHTHPAI